VIFSGAMVSLGLFGLTKLVFAVFAGSGQVRDAIAPLCLVGGSLTALVGGWMALLQRHLKRLLAFSTIAHAGIMLVGLGALSPGGTGGLLLYLVGHGAVKGALFMVAGILLATRASIDEIDLRGLGRGLGPAGLAMALAGLLLCGLPIGLLDQGTQALHGALRAQGHPVALAATLVGARLTGGAVLRAAGRIFLGWGADPGDEAQAPIEAEQERANRPLWLMLGPASVLLALDLLAPEERVGEVAAHAVPSFMRVAGTVELPHAPPWTGWLAVTLALSIAAFALFRDHLPGWLKRSVRATQSAPTRALETIHSGLIGDYAAWLVAGLAVLAALLALV
jgi:multicomponent Na+:H+ antiporter subunit D